MAWWMAEDASTTVPESRKCRDPGIGHGKSWGHVPIITQRLLLTGAGEELRPAPPQDKFKMKGLIGRRLGVLIG